MWLLFAIIAAILWGLNYSLSEKLLQSISVMTLLGLEMLVGSLLFLAIAYFTTLKKDIATLIIQPKILWLTILEIGIVLLASFFILHSIRSKNASLAGTIELIYPIFTIFFTWFLFKENNMNWSVLVGGLFIFTGVIIVDF